MDELILQPNESIILLPDEALRAEERLLQIHAGINNSFNHMEKMLWTSLKRSTGNQTAVYRRGDEYRIVCVVPETAQADSFGYEDITLTTTSRIFKVGKADLAGWLPKHGDTLDYNNTVYTVKKTSNANNTYYQDVGNHGIILRIHVMEYR